MLHHVQVINDFGLDAVKQKALLKTRFFKGTSTSVQALYTWVPHLVNALGDQNHPVGPMDLYEHFSQTVGIKDEREIHGLLRAVHKRCHQLWSINDAVSPSSRPRLVTYDRDKARKSDVSVVFDRVTAPVDRAVECLTSLQLTDQEKERLSTETNSWVHQAWAQLRSLVFTIDQVPGWTLWIDTWKARIGDMRKRAQTRKAIAYLHRLRVLGECAGGFPLHLSCLVRDIEAHSPSADVFGYSDGSLTATTQHVDHAMDLIRRLRHPRLRPLVARLDTQTTPLCTATLRPEARDEALQMARDAALEAVFDVPTMLGACRRLRANQDEIWSSPLLCHAIYDAYLLMASVLDESPVRIDMTRLYQDNAHESRTIDPDTWPLLLTRDPSTLESLRAIRLVICNYTLRPRLPERWRVRLATAAGMHLDSTLTPDALHKIAEEEIAECMDRAQEDSQPGPLLFESL